MKSSCWEIAELEYSMERIIHAAELYWADESKFVQNLKSKNETIRYWGVIGLCAFEKRLSVNALSALKGALIDSSPSVRIEAANTLMRNGHPKPALSVLIEELEHENLIVVSHAARTIELLGNKAKNAIPAMKACLKRAYSVRPPELSPVIVLPGDQDMAMFVGFSCNAFLKKVK